jgi:hypothetical protein
LNLGSRTYRQAWFIRNIDGWISPLSQLMNCSGWASLKSKTFQCAHNVIALATRHIASKAIDGGGPQQQSGLMIIA